MKSTRQVMVVVAFVFGLLGLMGLGAREAYAGCGSDSDCAGLGKCSSGECGHCGSDSDCNGHGKCSSGMCGHCGSDSDCSNGRCSNGRCGGCGSDSDCRGNGRCSNSHCGSCGSDSDCSVGRCSNSHCGSCGSDSDCRGGRCSNSRCSNALSTDADFFPGQADDDCNFPVTLDARALRKLSCPLMSAGIADLVTTGMDGLLTKLSASR